MVFIWISQVLLRWVFSVFLFGYEHHLLFLSFSLFELSTRIELKAKSFVYLIDFQALELDISKQLAAYEVEYHVIQEEVVASISSAPTSPKSHTEGSMLASMQLEESNLNLQKQIRELQTQLQRAKTSSCLLEVRLKESQSTQANLERQVISVIIYIAINMVSVWIFFFLSFFLSFFHSFFHSSFKIL